MIYLIDDKIKQSLGASMNEFENKFKEIISLLPGIKLSEYESLEHDLATADIIMIHDTLEDFNDNGEAIRGSSKVRNSILEEMGEENGVKLVIFSGGIASCSSDDDSARVYMPRRDFYENLENYLTYLSKYQINDLRILMYGMKYVYEEIERISRELYRQKVDEGNIDESLLKRFYGLTKTDDDFENFRQQFSSYAPEEMKQKLQAIEIAFMRHG